MCLMAFVPLTAGKRIVIWQDLFDMTDILSAYVSAATAEIATVSGSSRDLCVALDQCEPEHAGHM